MPVEFKSRFLRPCNGTLVLVGKREGTPCGNTLVFTLETCITNIVPVVSSLSNKMRTICVICRPQVDSYFAEKSAKTDFQKVYCEVDLYFVHPLYMKNCFVN